MTQYAVVGDPIAHSKSPEIHRLFAEQTGEDVEYAKHRVEAPDFVEFVNRFFAKGGGGLNITLPHKEAAFALAKDKSQQAQLARAVNTLWINGDGVLAGENTDGAGIVNDLRNNQVTLAGKNVLMLGAGGAARGALAALVSASPNHISLLNRTRSKAEALRSDFAHVFDIEVGDYSQELSRQFDVIINGTAMSLSGEVPALDPRYLAPACCCYDMMYGSEPTAFMTWADQYGAETVLDGLGMLVEQAAESFLLWRGVKPETAPVINRLR